MSVSAAAYDVTGIENMFWSMAETASTLNLNPRDAMHPMVAERPQDLNRMRLEFCINFWNFLRDTVATNADGTPNDNFGKPVYFGNLTYEVDTNGIPVTDGSGNQNVIVTTSPRDDFVLKLHQYLHGTGATLVDGQAGRSIGSKANRFLANGAQNNAANSIIQNFLYPRFAKKIAVTSFSKNRVAGLFSRDSNDSYYTPSNCSADVFTKKQLEEIFDDATRPGVNWMIEEVKDGDNKGKYYVPDIRDGDRFGITMKVLAKADQPSDASDSPIRDLSIDGQMVTLDDKYKSFNIVFAHDRGAASMLEYDGSGAASERQMMDQNNQLTTYIPISLHHAEINNSSLWFTVQNVNYIAQGASAVSGQFAALDNDEDGAGNDPSGNSNGEGSTVVNDTQQFT